MPTSIQHLETIRSQTLQQIEAITASPKPTYRIGDQQVNWQEYLASLRDTVAWCDRQLADGTPFEVLSQGTSNEC